MVGKGGGSFPSREGLADLPLLRWIELGLGSTSLAASWFDLSTALGRAGDDHRGRQLDLIQPAVQRFVCSYKHTIVGLYEHTKIT